ncbi:hypothetical protein BDN72DRAFT_958035 [Pluteus cervinus]|uniref:Uncharacterized protein n=1 Tax=Pluteus cervinus TaxID=181527 RepID=A0ACD3B0V1_9AGAR|nr:hypothetical protein BDN72DRAFT_958035 [Pluteus cervinus]
MSAFRSVGGLYGLLKKAKHSLYKAKILSEVAAILNTRTKQIEKKVGNAVAGAILVQSLHKSKSDPKKHYTVHLFKKHDLELGEPIGVLHVYPDWSMKVFKRSRRPLTLGPQQVFPPEIEETIFSLAVQTDWANATNLILVAKRIHQWLIPQIYKVAIFYDSRSEDRPTFSSRALIRHGEHVRHILFYTGSSALVHQPEECLAWCPNLLNVALWIVPSDLYDSNLVNQLLRVRLTHLSFDFSCFRVAFERNPEILLPISFPSVTHLELVNTQSFVSPQELDEYFPAVTHLALNAAVDLLASITNDILELWTDRIRVLIWYVGVSYQQQAPSVLSKSDYPDSSSDPRHVVIEYGRGFVGTWYEGANGRLGIWKLAEEAIADELTGSG